MNVDVHEALFALARDSAPTLTEILDRLDDLEKAGHTLPKEARAAYTGINQFLQQYNIPAKYRG